MAAWRLLVLAGSLDIAERHLRTARFRRIADRTARGAAAELLAAVGWDWQLAHVHLLDLDAELAADLEVRP